MTDVIPLKVGEVLVPKDGTTWQSLNWKQLELVSVTRHKNVTQWWVKMTSSTGAETLHTLSIGTIRDGWVRKPTFFKIGKTYQFSTQKWNVSDTYRVIEVAHVDDPLTPNDDVIALAIGKDSMTGRQYGTSLNRSDFGKMELV